MYASSCRLLLPFGAMNGFWGTVGADTALGVAGEPTNAGTAATSEGFWGIGAGGTRSARAEGAANSNTAIHSAPAAPVQRSPPRASRPAPSARARFTSRAAVPDPSANQ